MSLPLESTAPDFELSAIAPSGERRISLKSLRGSWVVLFFYPADFSFVCPTELGGFASRYPEFQAAGAEVLSVSGDSIESHREWAVELGGIPFPMLADPGNLVAEIFGAATAATPPERATFILDPEGRLAFEMRVARNVGRGVAETLRVLLALQTGRLCPADWQPGQLTLDVPQLTPAG